jgi:hypothetical protein
MTMMKILRCDIQLPNQKSQVCHHRGFTVLEVSVSGALLAVLMVITAQMLSWVLGERRAAERRLWATAEVENVMDRLSAVPWDELTSQRVGAEQLSAQAAAVLPEGKFHVEIAAETDSPEAKRIDLVLEWQRRPSEWAAPVRLSAWRYRRGETTQ